MSRSTWAEWDPPLRSRFGGFTPVAATGHGWQPLRKRFTRTLEAAIVEGARERQQRERERKAALAIKRSGR